MDQDNLSTDPADNIEQYNVVKLFSNPSVVKILSVLMHQVDDLPAGSITDKADVARNSWYRNQDLLIQMDLIEKTREEAGTAFFQLKDNQKTRAFQELAYRLDEADLMVETIRD